MFKFKGGRRGKSSESLGSKYLINDDIRAKEVFVISDDGEKLGVVSISEAINLAEDKGLDLVQMGKQSGDEAVVVKIMDFGKFLYSKKKQLNESKKHQKVIQVKEVKIRPNIGDQDYKTKLNRAVDFLKSGKKVKFTIQFRGREMIMKNELGRKMFDRIGLYLAEQGLSDVVEEKEQRGGPFWTKIYFLK